jgi:antagonist of KipI
MSMQVLRPGLLTSIQDLGRFGYQKHGVIVSGAMDAYSLRIANLLVGNAEGEAALEITLMGPTLKIKQDTLLAITGGDLSPRIGEEPLPMWKSVFVKEGSILQFGACKSGCRSYLAVAGGFRIAEVMGSKSTYLRAGIGGYSGRALQEGDKLEYEESQTLSHRIFHKLKDTPSSGSLTAASWYTGRGHIGERSPYVTVRAMRGSQFEHFDAHSKAELFDKPFRVAPQSDRMGYRLSGPVLKLAEPLEMVSEAVALGTVQAPPDGNPIILLADRQSVGGYPRIAQIAVVDIPVIAQMKPGEQVKLQEISPDEAERLFIEREEEIQKIRIGINLTL